MKGLPKVTFLLVSDQYFNVWLQIMQQETSTRKIDSLRHEDTTKLCLGCNIHNIKIITLVAAKRFSARSEVEGR